MKTNFQPFLLAGLAIVVLAGCKSQQYTIDNLPAQQIVFGNGGGFTGAYTEFVLLENGQLFKKESMLPKTTELGTVKKRTAQKMLKKAISLHLEQMDINQPGNMYFYVQYKNDHQDAKCVWGNQEYRVDAKIESFYKELMQMTTAVVAPKK